MKGSGAGASASPARRTAAVSHDGEGNTHERRYDVAETRALAFGAGESMIHDLVNAGTEDIVFTTVEFLDSANEPLPLTGAARP